MTSKHLRNSTALALVLMLGLQVPPNAAFAQQSGADCAANPEACAEGAGSAAGAGDGTDTDQAAPVEAPAAEEAAPAVEDVAPAAEKAPEIETPEVEAPAVETPEAETPDVETPAADELPAEPAPANAAPAAAPPEPATPEAPVDAQPEAAPAEESVPEAPASDAAQSAEPAAPPAAEEAPLDQVDEPVPADTAEPAPESVPAEEAAPASEPARKPEPAPAPSEPAAESSTEPGGEPATDPAAPVEPSAPAEETAPAAKPVQESAPDEPATKPQTAEPAAEDRRTGRQKRDREDGRGSRQDVGSGDGGGRPANRDVTNEPGESMRTGGAAQPEEPAAVVSDDISDQQRAENRAREDRRRDEARDRRLELLGAAAVGAGIGMLIPALGGKVVEDQGDRIIVERDGEYFVRKDESSLLRYGDAEVRAERLRGGRTRETVTRRNGTQVVTIRDEGGYVLYRSRITPDGREYVMVDNREPRRDRRRRDFSRELPPLRIDIPRETYIVPARRAGYDEIYRTFTAPPVEQVEEAYSLREVRESERLRDKVRRVDLDSITFDTGSAVVRQSQVPYLEEIARATNALIEQDPTTVLLVEGHTDAVGSDISNLALSDRRAETVARILTEYYDVPPENMVVQGYGEDYLKIDTRGAEERNRRVTLRNITPLLSAGKQ